MHNKLKYFRLDAEVKVEFKRLFAINLDIQRGVKHRVKGDTFCNMLLEILQIKKLNGGIFRQVTFVTWDVNLEKLIRDDDGRLNARETSGIIKTEAFQIALIPPN